MSDELTMTRPAKKPATSEDFPETPGKGGGWPADPPRWLWSKGWRPEGDPRHPQTLWRDPARPTEAKEEYRVIGKRTLPNKAVVDVKQLHVTPAVMGVTLAEAVAEQLRREQQGK